MKSRLFFAAFLAIGLCSAGEVHARGGAMVCYSDAIPFTLTNFNLTLSVPLFNPDDAYGDGTNIHANLTRVSLWLDADLLGDAELTNLSESPISMFGSLAATVVVERPDLSPLLTVLLNAPFGPTTVNELESLTVGPLADFDFMAASLNSAPDLSLFTGPGTLVLPVRGTGSFVAEGGGGNVVSVSTASARAAMDVCYHFASAPEPTTLTFLAGAAAITFTRRRRQAA